MSVLLESAVTLIPEFNYVPCSCHYVLFLCTTCLCFDLLLLFVFTRNLGTCCYQGCGPGGNVMGCLTKHLDTALTSPPEKNSTHCRNSTCCKLFGAGMTVRSPRLRIQSFSPFLLCPYSPHLYCKLM